MRDPGAAVYFKLESVPEGLVLACDRWLRVEDNIAAVAAHIRALRGIDRWGVGSVRQAFAGYKRLTGGDAPTPWWEVLGIDHEATAAAVKKAYKELAKPTTPTGRPGTWNDSRPSARRGRSTRKRGRPRRGQPQGREEVRAVESPGAAGPAAMAHRDTSVSELCREFGIRPVTLYRYVGPQGQLREQGQKVLASLNRLSEGFRPPSRKQPENASRTRSHWAAGRKNASNRPKFFAPSMARLPVWDLVAHLEEQRALPAAAVRHAVLADERLPVQFSIAADLTPVLALPVIGALRARRAVAGWRRSPGGWRADEGRTLVAIPPAGLTAAILPRRGLVRACQGCRRRPYGWHGDGLSDQGRGATRPRTESGLSAAARARPA